MYNETIKKSQNWRWRRIIMADWEALEACKLKSRIAIELHFTQSSVQKMNTVFFFSIFDFDFDKASTLNFRFNGILIVSFDDSSCPLITLSNMVHHEVDVFRSTSQLLSEIDLIE